MFSENRWPCNIFLMCGNKKKSLSAKSRLCGGWLIHSTFWPVKKTLIWADVRELALPLWTMIRRFSNFSKEIVVWTTQNWPCIIAQVEQSLNPSRRNRRPFASKCFLQKQLSLDLAYVRRHTWWTVVLFRAHTHWFVTYDDLINVFWSTAIVLFQHFYAPIYKSLFWEIAGFSENKSFYGQLFMQYWMYSVGRHFRGCLYLTVCHMTILH